MKRVAILLPDLRGGGAERVNLDLAHEFARAGHRVEFVLMRARGELLEEARASSAIADLECDRMRQVPPALARYLRRARPDVLIAAMWPLTGIAALVGRFVRSVDTSIIVSEHVDFRATPALKRMEKHLLRACGNSIYGPVDGVVAVSDGVADSLVEIAGLPRERIEVIHNPVRAPRLEGISEADGTSLRRWLDSPAPVIAIGALKTQKRFDVLIRAFELVQQSADAHLLILGEGPLRSDLTRLVQQLGLEHCVFMPGFRSNIHDFLEHARCFALSSDWEGFGNVLVEALSVGTPVVSTDCPSGPREILVDGRFGRLVPPGDVVGLAAAIVETLESTADAAFLKSRADDFEPASQADRYMRLMKLER